MTAPRASVASALAERYAQVNAIFDPVREHSRFAALVESMRS